MLVNTSVIQHRHNLYKVIEGVNLFNNRIDIQWVLPTSAIVYSKNDYHVSMYDSRKFQTHLLRPLAPSLRVAGPSIHAYGTLYCFNKPKTFLYCVKFVLGEVWYVHTEINSDGWILLSNFSIEKNIL